jgi:hypothetical protein
MNLHRFLVGAALAASPIAAHAADAAPAVRPLVGFGLTFGGDTLATVQFSDGTTDSIKAGGLAHVYAGAEFKVGTAMAIQATLGYHVDDTRSSSNGSLRFSRYPVDLIALYSLNERVRLGAGAQIVGSAKLAGSGVASAVAVDFQSSTGALVEAEYLFTPNLGAKLRFVSHTYKPKGSGISVDGNHVGLMLGYYF